ncbi:MAG TPA: hypothetical protein VMM37_06360, partial [Bacteroidota bacterium]|nr:hypothetical protein [Bacteroidota bacterium]
MEKHIKLVGILNIVYRSTTIIGACVLFLLAALFGRFMEFLERRGELHAEDIPAELFDLIPILVVVLGLLLIVVA